MASRDHDHTATAATPSALPPIPVCDFSGDLLCPLCGEPLEIIIQRTEYGAETAGRCADCVTIVEIGP